ncbi:hypothetical protein OG230_20475 [Streptomyces sp. NBC_00234]|uniref:hypothetical protein n=1 Tax=Streptomyces sp. NBC_00234 TaxID=2903638 RepID=UPI002E28CB6F|nr:hypothetical protein [Streptomyces sp. NBC_00234]
MITRRGFLGAAAGTGVLALAHGTLIPAPAAAAETRTGPGRWRGDVSANGWPIDPDAIRTLRIEGSGASAALCEGAAATVLLHVARRWHYEIAPLDTGEGGGITAHTERRAIGADFESNHLSGTAVALHPTAYPLGGGEGMWPHHELIVRDILADCEGTVTWGGDLDPVKLSHFHLRARPGSPVLAAVAARLDTAHHTASRLRTAGAAEDPGAPARRAEARRVRRDGAG